MAKVINSNKTSLINADAGYHGRKKYVYVGGFVGLGSDKFYMESCTNLKVMDDEVMMGTSTGGKFAGAGVGALLTGGTGAIVGSMIGGGNKKIKNKKIALEFGSDWLVLEFTEGMVDSMIMKALLEDCQVEQASPFA